MAVLGKDTKQPNEVEDYDVDFGDWMPTGDSINTVESSVRVLSGPVTPPLVVVRVLSTSTLSKARLSGGADGAKYRVQLRAETVGGLVKEAEFDITVKEV